MTFKKFASIGRMSDAVFNARKMGITQMSFTVKQKLHGTNAAIRVSGDDVRFQKRTADVQVGNDNAGFAAWASNLDWRDVKSEMSNYIIYGEWAGPGVQKSDAVSKIPEKTFFPFVVYDVDGDYCYNNPDMIELFCPVHPNIKVIPYFNIIDIDFNSQSNLDATADYLNQKVEEIGEKDPYIFDEFGIEGVGEGLVITPEFTIFEIYGRLSFKVKSEAHSVNKSSKAANPQVEVPADVKAFVDMFVTPQRASQMVRETFPDGFSMKDTGAFLKAMSQDIIKESKNELEASNLSWKDVVKEVNKASVKLFTKLT